MPEPVQPDAVLDWKSSRRAWTAAKRAAVAEEQAHSGRRPVRQLEAGAFVPERLKSGQPVPVCSAQAVLARVRRPLLSLPAARAATAERTRMAQERAQRLRAVSHRSRAVVPARLRELARGAVLRQVLPLSAPRVLRRHPHRRSRTPRALRNPQRASRCHLHSCGAGDRHDDRGGASASIHRPRFRNATAPPALELPRRSRARGPAWATVQWVARWSLGHRASAAQQPVAGQAEVCVAAGFDAVPRRAGCPVAGVARDVVAVGCRYRAGDRDRVARVSRRAFRRGVVGHCRVRVCRVSRWGRVRPGFSPAPPVCGTSSSCARRNRASGLAPARWRARAFRAPGPESPARCR